MRRLWKIVVLGGFAGMCVLGAGAAGFMMERMRFEPFHSIANRIERKMIEVSGMPTPEQQRLAQIETTSIRLKGTVYDTPHRIIGNGGALTVWGDDLLVLARTGEVFRFAEGRGLVETSIRLPDNGLAAYTDLAAADAYQDYTHKPGSIRFNDITYVDSGPHHGLAISYTFFDPERVCYGTRIDWLPLPQGAAPADLDTAPQDWQHLFETNPCLPLNKSWTALDGIMAGGRMTFQAPASLVLASGEYHLDGVHTYDVGIQSDDTDYGKVIRISLEDGSAQHLSKGHRNTQGVTIDLQGQIWAVEHGVRGGDELNLVQEGRNYGWPVETLGTLYSGQPFPTEGEIGRHVLNTKPAYAWLPSAAVSALTVIDGFHPTWDGDLLVGSLSSAEFGQSLFRMRMDGERVVFAERISLQERIRYVTQFKDKIAVWTDKRQLILLEITQREDPLGDAIAALSDSAPGPLATQVAQALRSCNECHSFEQGNHIAAPSLNGVVGRGIGGSGYTGYSDALSGMGGVWTAERLAAYLDDPQATAPGTAMPDPNLEPGEVLNTLVDVLQSINTTDDTHLTYN